MSAVKKVKGFNDIFPPTSGIYTQMEQIAREVFSSYGYRELRLPLLERTELFARSLGSETDVVQKEMYSFLDHKGRSLTMRPEATAGVLRAYIENKHQSWEGLSKLFTFGPMFRYERPQKGRQRQFHQINAELIGSAAPQSDAELILMLWTFLRGLGLEDLGLDINSLGCSQCRPAYHQALGQYLSGVDPNRLCADCRRRSKTNPLRVLDCKERGCQQVLQGAPRLADYLCPECHKHFASLCSLLGQAGLSYEINPRLVRGLDYYQRTTFEVVAKDIGAQSAVAGGGRYDGLIRDLGGPNLPGTGFACGMERLALLSKAPKKAKTDFYLAVSEPEACNQAILIGQDLREQGLHGRVSFEARSFKSQLRLANKAGVSFCLLLGADELARQEVLVKDMTSGNQTAVACTNLARYLKDNIHSG